MRISQQSMPDVAQHLGHVSSSPVSFTHCRLLLPSCRQVGVAQPARGRSGFLLPAPAPQHCAVRRVSQRPGRCTVSQGQGTSYNTRGGGRCQPGGGEEGRQKDTSAASVVTLNPASAPPPWPRRRQGSGRQGSVGAPNAKPPAPPRKARVPPMRLLRLTGCECAGFGLRQPIQYVMQGTPH